MSAPANGNGNGAKIQNIVSIVILMLFVGGAFWALAYSPISGKLTELTEGMKTYVVGAVFAEYKIQVGKDVLRLEWDIEKLQDQLKTERVERLSVISTKVSKELFDAKWTTYEALHEELSKKVADTNAQLAKIVTPTDVIHTLGARLDRLEAEQMKGHDKP